MVQYDRIDILYHTYMLFGIYFGGQNWPFYQLVYYDTVSLRGTSQSDAMPPPLSSSISPTTHSDHVSHSQKHHVSINSAISHSTSSETQWQQQSKMQAQCNWGHTIIQLQANIKEQDRNPEPGYHYKPP